MNILNDSNMIMSLHFVLKHLGNFFLPDYTQSCVTVNYSSFAEDVPPPAPPPFLFCCCCFHIQNLLADRTGQVCRVLLETLISCLWLNKPWAFSSDFSFELLNTQHNNVPAKTCEPRIYNCRHTNLSERRSSSIFFNRAHRYRSHTTIKKNISQSVLFLRTEQNGRVRQIRELGHCPGDVILQSLMRMFTWINTTLTQEAFVVNRFFLKEKRMDSIYIYGTFHCHHFEYLFCGGLCVLSEALQILCKTPNNEKKNHNELIKE